MPIYKAVTKAAFGKRGGSSLEVLSFSGVENTIGETLSLFLLWKRENIKITGLSSIDFSKQAFSHKSKASEIIVEQSFKGHY